MPTIKIKQYSVPHDEPFSSDIFKRKQLIESLVNLATKLEEPMVIGLTAPWGHGKSTILQRLKGHIDKNHKNDIGYIHYDAYKNDYVSDVFISFVSSINNFLDSTIGESTGEKKSLISQAKDELIHSGAQICKSLIKNALVRGVKHATSGLIDIPAIEEDIEGTIERTVSDSTNEIVDSASAGVEKLIIERFSEASKDQDIIEVFTKKLQCAIESTEKKRLIFIIDELDRCQPSFAVEVLEKIKHFFSCEKVLFILSYNKEQLNQSIRHIYGVNNPNIYLQRFIDLESDVSTKLDSAENEQSFNEYIAYLINAHSFEQNWNDAIKEVILNSFRILEHNYSLRAAERICTKVASYCLIRAEGEYIYDKHTIVFLCVLSVCEPTLFESIYKRAVFISNFPHDEDPTISINETEKNLKKILTLVKSEKSFLSLMYDYLIAYLKIQDGDNSGRTFQSRGGFINTNSYLKKCCELISTLIIA